ncbi:PaaI family thioesterase [Corynebacterium mayonis]|uniref:PaaI family thioesterase n=1 Tax=Corynebacterium mayonis TaxID=3062461 RepID=UPI003140395B
MEHRYAKEIIDTPLSAAELAAFAQHSGLSGQLGIEITYVARDRVEGFVDVGEQHHQPAGVANGGLYCSVGETLGSVGAIAAAGKPAVGMNNNTDLLGSVVSGRVEAVAVPVHVGTSTHLWRIEMRHGGKLVATTNLKVMVLDRR